MFNNVEIWRWRSSNIGWISLYTLLVPFLFFLYLLFTSVNTTYIFIISPHPTVKLDCNPEGNLMPCLVCILFKSITFENLIVLWTLTVVLGIWTLPQLYAGVNLAIATSPDLQDDSKLVLERLEKWFYTQFKFWGWEAACVVLCALRYLTKEKTNTGLEQHILGGAILFFFACVIIRGLCFAVVLTYNDLFENNWVASGGVRGNSDGEVKQSESEIV